MMKYDQVKSTLWCIALLSANLVYGAPIFWTGSGDGIRWNDSNNWNCTCLPGNEDDVTISNGSTVQLNSAPVIIRTLSINNTQLQLLNGSRLFILEGLWINANASMINQGELRIKKSLTLTDGNIENVGYLVITDFTTGISLSGMAIFNNSGMISILFPHDENAKGIDIGVNTSFNNTGTTNITSGDIAINNHGQSTSSGRLYSNKTNVLAREWTSNTPSSDSRIIYVSTSGNDATAIPYTVTSVQVGGNAFMPEGTINAFATLEAAKSQLRPGFPDYLLLKSGEVWNSQSFGTVSWNGRNKLEPMVIASYGEGPRPIINTANQTAINLNSAMISHIAIMDIHFTPNPLGSGIDIGGITCFSPFENILLENCHISAFPTNLSMHGTVSGIRNNLTIRRCIMTDAAALNNAGGQNFFIDRVDSILMEECVLDHNGWNPDIGTFPTGFRHNSYFQVGNTNIKFRKNIVARAAATGIGMRCGGKVEGNLVLENVNNIQFGTHEETINYPTEFVTGTITGNVILNARNESFDPGRGIFVAKAKNVLVNNNIIKDYTPVQLGSNAIITADGYENITIDSNIVYNWCPNIPFGPGTFYETNNAIQLLAGGTGSNVISHNQIQQHNAGGGCINTQTYTNKTFDGNMYYNLTQNNAFQNGNISYTNWLTQSAETGSTFGSLSYIDPDRNIESYLISIGQTGDLIDFMFSARQQRKGNWNNLFDAQPIIDYIKEGFDITTSMVKEPHDAQSLLMRIYPNPVNDLIHFNESEGMYDSANLATIYDLEGKQITAIKIQTDEPIDVSIFPKGMYVLQIGKHKMKFVKI